MNTTTKIKRAERLDFRISSENKRIIEQAASLNEQTVSDFVLSVTLPIAKEKLAESHVTKLSKRDRDLFLKLLDDDSEPNQNLKKGAKKYQEYLKERNEK
jgi:uncharacterized protein (DUF1778 family)